MCEFGQVHRHEFSGALNGLLRVRTFCQDDAHLFVTPKQIEDEIKSVMAQIDYVYKTFGFEYEVELLLVQKIQWVMINYGSKQKQH